MWKDSYLLGIDTIDAQHIELFKAVDNFVKSLKSENFTSCPSIGQSMISFLKEYGVKHFSDEEAYLRSIQYKNFDYHQKEHQKFIHSVLTYEKKLIASNYDIKVLKDLAGMLIAWLVYHVAKEDQLIKGSSAIAPQGESSAYADIFGQSVTEVLESMTNISAGDLHIKIHPTEALSGDIFIEVEFIELELLVDYHRSVLFSFSRELSFQLLKSMTFIEATKIDELTCSAMSEISNIVSGSAATRLLQHGIHTDIKPPILSIGHYADKYASAQCTRIAIDTALGRLEIAFDC